MNVDSLTQNAKQAIIQNSLKQKNYQPNQTKMKEERYLKDREAIIRADIWKEITTSCKGLTTDLGYTNGQIVDFLKEITKTFERDQL